MVKIAFVADVHVDNHKKCGGPKYGGINRRAQGCLDALGGALREAQERECDKFVILGDLFDTTSPRPPIVKGTLDLLRSFDLDVLVLMGNHDMESDEPGDNAVDVLQDVTNDVSVQTYPQVICCQGSNLVMVPFQPGDASEWLPEVLEHLSSSQGRSMVGGTLCLHLGLSDKQTEFWLRSSHDSVSVDLVRTLMDKHGIARCFSGNWHRYARWDQAGVRNPIIQCSALAPTGWDNPGLGRNGFMLVLDTETGETERVIIPGPRFLTVSSDGELSELLTLLHEPPYREFYDSGGESPWQFYLRWRSTREDWEHATKTVVNAIKSNAITDGFVEPDRRESMDGAVAGALAAQGTFDDSSDESLVKMAGKYVENMDLPEHIDPDFVAALVDEFLGAAKGMV